MDRKPPLQRKAYQKPEISRVDLVEDEVALAACKANFVSAHSTPNAGINKCKGSCKAVSPT